MPIDGIEPVHLRSLERLKQEQDTPIHEEFANILQEALGSVNEVQKEAQGVAQDFALGNIDSIHKVMIASETAQLAMDLTLAIQQQVLDTYKELMRLQF